MLIIPERNILALSITEMESPFVQKLDDAARTGGAVGGSPFAYTVLAISVVVIIIGFYLIATASYYQAGGPGATTPITVAPGVVKPLPGAVSNNTPAVTNSNGQPFIPRAPLTVNWINDSGQLWGRTDEPTQCQYPQAHGLRFNGLPSSADRTLFGLTQTPTTLALLRGGKYTVSFYINVKKYQGGADFGTTAHLILNYGRGGQDILTPSMETNYAQLSGPMYPQASESAYRLSGSITYDFSPSDTITLMLTTRGDGSCPSVAWESGTLTLTPA